MKKHLAVTAVLGAAVLVSGYAVARGQVQLDPGLQPYKTVSGVSGNLSSVGSDTLNNLMTHWAETFSRFYPNAKVQIEGKGSSTAPPALIAGTAQLGPMSREMKGTEIDQFEKKFGYKPIPIRTSVDALAVFVNKDNPIKCLSMGQVDAVFSKSRRTGAKEDVTTWGQLGLTGEWASRPLDVYGYGADSGFGRFFRMLVLNDSYRWNSEMKEFYNAKAADGSDIDSGQLILDALAKDPYGIAYSNVSYMNANVKTLAVASKDGGPFMKPTKENVWKRTYPITRFTTVFINRAPGKPVEPKVREFLRYILSRDGQETVLREGSYLPLTADVIRDQLRKLE